MILVADNGRDDRLGSAGVLQRVEALLAVAGVRAEGRNHATLRVPAEGVGEYPRQQRITVGNNRIASAATTATPTARSPSAAASFARPANQRINNTPERRKAEVNLCGLF